MEKLKSISLERIILSRSSDPEGNYKQIVLSSRKILFPPNFKKDFFQGLEREFLEKLCILVKSFSQNFFSHCNAPKVF